jgi:hypothetical protein
MNHSSFPLEHRPVSAHLFEWLEVTGPLRQALLRDAQVPVGLAVLLQTHTARAWLRPHDPSQPLGLALRAGDEVYCALDQVIVGRYPDADGRCPDYAGPVAPSSPTQRSAPRGPAAAATTHTDAALVWWLFARGVR